MKPWLSLALLVLLEPGCLEMPDGETPPAEASAVGQQGWEPCDTSAVRLADIHPGPPGSEPRELTHGYRGLFFAADDGTHGRELWHSGGTRDGTPTLVKDIHPGPAGSEPRDLTKVGDRLFFSADDGVHGRELWVSDGTAAGTFMVMDIRPGPDGAVPIPSVFTPDDPPRLIEFKGVLYFSANDGVQGPELWRSDGTAAGTYLVEKLNPTTEGSSPRRFIRGGDHALYFVGNEEFDVHLWRSTGAPGAVSMLERVEDNVIFRPAVVKSHLFFLVDNDEGEASLWVTEGTAASTRALRFFHGKYPHDLVALGDRLIFSAGGPNPSSGLEGEPEGEELWVSDGTVAGTKLVKDIHPGPAGSSPSALAVLGRHVFFAADDGSGQGRELWVSDGTASGTVLFKDLEPGAGSSSPEALTSIRGILFFSADTSGRGREPWVSDGTRRDTEPLDELAPGAASSSPRDFIRSGWDVFFTAEEPGTGRELWAIPFRPGHACDTRHRR